MTFELESLTKVRVLDVRVLAAKDRKPDDQPGAQLLLQATLPAGVLAMFDGFLPGMLYRSAEGGKQGSLDGMEGQELTPIGDHVKRLKWQYEQTGCTVEIDHGTGGKRNLVLADCKAHRVSLSPREGGSVVVQWTVDAPGLADSTWAKLPGMKATDIEMTMVGPEVAGDGQADIEGDRMPAAKSSKSGGWPFGDKGENNAPNTGGKKKGATDAFVDAHAGQPS